MALVPLVYNIAKHCPIEERFALADQLRRAVISVPANIAEGQARQYPREFLHLLNVARGSLAEVDTLVQVAIQLGYVRQSEVAATKNLMHSIRQLLQRLIQHVRTEAVTPRATTQRTRNAKR